MQLLKFSMFAIKFEVWVLTQFWLTTNFIILCLTKLITQSLQLGD